MKKSAFGLLAGMSLFALTPDAMAQDGVPGPAEDPFIWLEEARSDEALAWVEAENEKTRAQLYTDPRFEGLKAEALAIYDSSDRIPGVSFQPDGLHNFWQDADNPKGLLRRTTMESYRTDDPEWETILDVDALAAAEGREWVYRGMSCLQPERTKCLVYLSDGGKDATEAREFDLATKSFVEDGFFIPEGLNNIDWIDEDTLLVGREWVPGEVTESLYAYVVKTLKRGESFDAATEIFRGEKSDVWAGVSNLRDDDGVIRAQVAFRGTDFWNQVQFLKTDDGWTLLEMPGKVRVGGIIGDQITFSLREDWQRGDTLYKSGSSLSANLEEWKADPNGVALSEIFVPGERQTLLSSGSTPEALYVSVLDNVRSQVWRYTVNGGVWSRERVSLPDNATISISAASSEADEVIFSVSDFLTPVRRFYKAAGSDDLAVIKSAPERFDAAGMEVVQHYATSADGTEIPYFLIKPAGMDGPTPTIMYGYGGFQSPQLPSYLDATGKLWLEKGGAYVVTNLRGGGEFGPDWHQTAMGPNKQRTWDDFIAVGEDLIARGYTDPDKLGVSGGSQGGLLVGTAFTQRPDLFDAAVVNVPLFDMLRYHLIGRGASWVGEYGDPRIAEERGWIEPYSPYQKLEPGKEFPKVLYVTSTADDRTHPAHGRKAAARMAANGQPYLYFEDTTGGHSGGVENDQRAARKAMEIVYLMQQLMD